MNESLDPCVCAPKQPAAKEGQCLLHVARNTGKHIVGITANQTYRANYEDEDDSEHHGVFGNVLTFLV